MVVFSNYDYDDYYIEMAKDNLETIHEDDYGDEPTREEIFAEAFCYMMDDLNNYYLPILAGYFDTHKCIVSGSIGRWDGARNGWSVIENRNEFYDLIDGCLYFEISEADSSEDDDGIGYLKIKCSHHDGTNYYYFRELTDKGYEKYKEFEWSLLLEDAKQNIMDFETLAPQIEWCL